MLIKIFFLTSLFLTINLSAQYKLFGKIIEEDGTPISNVNIALINPIDSTIISYSFSNSNGIFNIPVKEIDISDLFLRINKLNYSTLYKSIELDSIHSSKELVYILDKENIVLKEVYINKKKKKLYQRKMTP